MCPSPPPFLADPLSLSKPGGGGELQIKPTILLRPPGFSDLPNVLQIALGLNCLEPISLVGCQTDFQGNWSWQRGNTFHLHSGLTKFVLIIEFRT